MNSKARRHAAKFNMIETRLPEEQVMRLASTSRPMRTARRSHIDDLAVDQLATAMKDKLADCRARGRRGWDDPLQCSIEKLAGMLGEALCKGDPIDIANFCAMLTARGAGAESIAYYARLAFMRGTREIVTLDAARYRTLRDVPSDQLGQAGVPCISLPTGNHTGQHLTGADADHAIDQVMQ